MLSLISKDLDWRIIYRYYSYEVTLLILDGKRHRKKYVRGWIIYATIKSMIERVEYISVYKYKDIKTICTI
jgi:hypothetical protein